MREISLTQGKVAFVDDEDYIRVAVYKWQAVLNGWVWYAHGQVEGNTVCMHHFILKIVSRVDHIDATD